MTGQNDLERIAEALMPYADRRHAVLTRWGKQDRPRVFAQTREIGMTWLTFNGDEFLTNQGSYAPMIATDLDRLRGLRGLIVVVSGARLQPALRWLDALNWLRYTPGLESWHEELP